MRSAHGSVPRRRIGGDQKPVAEAAFLLTPLVAWPQAVLAGGSDAKAIFAGLFKSDNEQQFYILKPYPRDD